MVDILELKAQMVRAGKSSADVAKEMGISRQSLYNKLQGKAWFTIVDAEKLIEILDIENPASIFFAKE